MRTDNVVAAMIAIVMGMVLVAGVSPPAHSSPTPPTPSPATVDLAGCEANERIIGNALDQYAKDHHRHYPAALSALVPNYLKSIPLCCGTNSLGIETLSDTYSGSYQSVSRPHNAYTFYCSGDRHSAAGCPPNYPQYNSVQGLVPK